MVLFAGGLHGYLITATNYWQRPLLAIAGLLLIKPGWESDLIGAAIALVIITSQVLARRAALKPGIAAE